MSRLSTLTILVLLAMGCNEMKPQKSEVPPLATRRPTAVAPGHGPKEALSGSTKLSEADAKLVVAAFGDQTITLGELERQLNEQPSYVRVRYNTLEKKKEFLDNVIRFELLANEAMKRGYNRDPEVVFTMKQQMIKKLIDEDMDDLVSMRSITDEAVSKFYEENKSLYFKPEAVRVSAIVLNSKDTAARLLERLQGDFKAEPRKRRQIFTTAVDKNTLDPVGRARRGDTGFFTADGKDPETLKDLESPLPEAVRTAAFKLEAVNGLSPVIEADGKAFILLLTNRRPETSKALDDVKRQIRNKLFRDEKDAARDRFIADLRQGANVQVFEDKLTLLKDQAARMEVPGQREIQRLKDEAIHQGLADDHQENLEKSGADKEGGLP